MTLKELEDALAMMRNLGKAKDDTPIAIRCQGIDRSDGSGFYCEYTEEMSAGVIRCIESSKPSRKGEWMYWGEGEDRESVRDIIVLD